MDAWMNVRLVEARGDEARRLAQIHAKRRWPDDGLPPRHEKRRLERPLHPWAVFIDALTR